MLSLQRAQFIVMFPFYSFCSSVVVHSHSCRELFSSFLPGNSHCCRCFSVHRRCCAVRRSNTLNCCCSCYSSTLPPFSSLAHSCSLGAQNKLKTKNSFNWCFGFTQTQFLALVCLHCFFTRFWVFNYLLFKFIVVSCIYCCCIRHPWFGGAKECWWKCQFLRSISSSFEELLPPPPFFLLISLRNSCRPILSFGDWKKPLFLAIYKIRLGFSLTLSHSISNWTFHSIFCEIQMTTLV